MKVSHLAILSVVILACMGIFFTSLRKQPLSQNGRQWDSKTGTTFASLVHDNVVERHSSDLLWTIDNVSSQSNTEPGPTATPTVRTSLGLLSTTTPTPTPPKQVGCDKRVIYLSQYFRSSNPRRTVELEQVIQANLENPLIDRFIWWIPLEYQNSTPAWLSGDIVYMDGIPLFSTAISILQMRREVCAQTDGCLYIFTNTDIIVTPESVLQLCKRVNPGNLLALSRWQLHDLLDYSSATPINQAWSQDTWCWTGLLEITDAQKFPVGRGGSDNRIAYELAKQREVINPAKSIRLYHWHPVSAPRAWHKQPKVPPPYKTLPATE